MPIIKKTHKDNIKKFCVETLPWLVVTGAGMVALVVVTNKYEGERTNSYLETQGKVQETQDKAYDAYVQHLESVHTHLVNK